MARYSSSFAEALSTTDDLRTIQTAATGAGSVVKVYEVLIGGESASSAVVRFVANRPSAAPTGAATAVTAEKINPASPAATAVIASTYATSQPTLSTNDVLCLGFNAFGGVVRWVAAPDSEVVVGTQGAVAYLALRSRSGTSTCSGHVLWEEA